MAPKAPGQKAAVVGAIWCFARAIPALPCRRDNQDVHETGTAGHSHAGEPRDDGKPRIAFGGAGHVGTVLAVAFSRAGWPVNAVASRDPDRRARFSQLVPGARGFAERSALLHDPDLVFLPQPDDPITTTAGRLPLYSGQALV